MNEENPYRSPETASPPKARKREALSESQPLRTIQILRVILDSIVTVMAEVTALGFGLLLAWWIEIEWLRRVLLFVCAFGGFLMVLGWGISLVRGLSRGEASQEGNLDDISSKPD